MEFQEKMLLRFTDLDDQKHQKSKFQNNSEQTFKFESSAFAFVCLEISNLLKLEISTLLKLENSCLLLFSEGLKFQALEG